MDNEQLEIVQADRDAAAEIAEMHGETEFARACREGNVDDIDEVRAFARHRLAAIAAYRPLVIKEREAIVAWLREMEQVHLEHAESGRKYRLAARHHADACRTIAMVVERGDHLQETSSS